MPRLPCAPLLPAEIRVWTEALWAEAGEAPTAASRRAWLAGGVWLIARESVMIRRVRHAVLFGAGAALLAATAWSQATGFDSGAAWYLVATTVLILAGLPRLLRRRLGPVTDSQVARGLRTAAYVAIFILIAALVAMQRSMGAPGPHNSVVAAPLIWSFFLLVLVGYVAVILMLTGQRSRVGPAALVIGTGAGLALGAVMYSIMPLGMGKDASAPWLRGSAIDPLVAVAWVLLLAGPVAAALLAGWRHSGVDGQLPPADVKIRQSAAAGMLATSVGSLVVSVLGTVTLALLPRSGLVAGVLYPGQHLTAAAITDRAADLVSNGAPGYFLIWLFFPLIGIGLGAWTALAAWHRGSAAQPGHGPGNGGPDVGDKPPEPADGGYLAEPVDGQTSVTAGVFVAVRG
jgi:hypothetical protein